METRATLYGPALAAALLVGSGALIAGCSDRRDERAVESPATTYHQGASTTYNGAGTNGGTNVDGSGPGGPRDPNRYTTPQPYTAPPAAPGTTYVAPDGTVHTQ